MSAPGKYHMVHFHWHKRYRLIVLVALWSLIMGASSFWNWKHLETMGEMAALEQARASFERDVLARMWNAGHGGVYVPVTDETPPNIYLDVPDRDLETTDGTRLTMLNPAYMTRQMHELGIKRMGLVGHITSLKPIRPQNRPLEWERQALEQFESGVTEYRAIEMRENDRVLNYMAPLQVEKNCLKCHAQQGYKVGDIRGGISVGVPLAPYDRLRVSQFRPILFVHIGLWMLGLAVIGVVEKLYKAHDDLRREAETELRTNEGNLRSFFNANIDFLWVLDGDGRIQHVNETVVRRLGYSREDLNGRSVLDLHPSEQRERAEKVLMELLTGESESCLIPLLARYGEVIPVETYVTKGWWDDRPALFGISKDISKLKLSEEKYAHIYNSSPAIIGLSDLQTGQYIDVNPSFCDILGFTREEALGQTADALLKMDRDFSERGRQIIARDGALSSEETRIYSKDGRPVDVLISAEVLIMQEKKYLMTTAIDISERKRAEEALRYERNLFADGPVFIITWSPLPGRPVSYVSANVKKILGYDAETMTGSDFRFLDIMHPDDFARTEPVAERNIHDKTAQVWENRYRLKNSQGDYRWFYDFTLYQRDEAGEVLSIRGYLVDQTLQKQAEDEVRSQKERLSNIIEGTNVGTWEWNVQSGETIFNEKWANIIGYTLEELSPVSIDTWKRHAHPDDLPVSEALLQKHFSGELDYYDCEYRMQHKDGHWLWVLDRGKVVSWMDDGRPDWMFGTHQHISKRKEMEVQLKQSLDEKEMLLKEVHHRVKNNLQMITSLVRMQSRRENTPAVQNALGEALNRIKAIASIHEQLYRSSSLASVNAHDYLVKLIKDQTSQGRSSGMQIAIDVEIEHIRLNMDVAIPLGLLLNEVLTNTLKYAFPDHKANDNKITVSLKSIPDAEENEDERQAVLLYADNGQGLPEGFEWEKSDSLGYKLILGLAGQLNGTISLLPGVGVTYELLFRIPRIEP